VLIGGLSASVLVGLIGSMARAERPASTDPPPVVAGSTAPATTQPRSPTRAPAAPQAPVVPPDVQVTRPTTPPITTSHGT
jgi:hypothetical protein